jgi:hypothetical protein
MKNLILIFILFIPFIYALQITEVELNPSGTDTGHEWVEFYSEQEINLSEYKIINNDQDELFLNQTFKGYFLYYFQNQWLDNSEESISIYEGSQLIQKTSIFEDIENNEKTWQLCNEEWIFEEETKSSPNCNLESYSQEEDLEHKISSPKKEKITNFSFTSEPIIQETIHLNPKTIKTENSKETVEEKSYARYLILIFCILLLFLYLIKPRKKKNEWQ